MKKPTTGIVVDGSTRGNPGPSEYRGIDLATGNVLFHQKIGISTNNITEFIAVGHAVMLALKTPDPMTVYTDSQTAISWLRKKEVNSKLPISDVTEKSRDYSNRILVKLKTLPVIFNGIDIIVDNRVVVKKWYTSEYGEIPADFGVKK